MEPFYAVSFELNVVLLYSVNEPVTYLRPLDVRTLSV